MRLSRFYGRLIRRIEQLYASGASVAELHRVRAEVFRLAATQLAGAVGAQLETVDGTRLARMPLNNAVLLARRLYVADLERFDRLLEEGQDLRGAVADLARRAGGVEDPWTLLPPAPVVRAPRDDDAMELVDSLPALPLP